MRIALSFHSLDKTTRQQHNGDSPHQRAGEGPPGSSQLFSASVAPRERLPPRRVDHTYRNYSNFPLDGRLAGKKAPNKFPCKLHQILSIPEYSHIISWMPHGRAWKIHNKDLLMREIVPKYFVQSKFESFTRQLNGWGFKRLHQSGNDFNAYYHECFLRGIPHLTALMKRVQPNQGKLLPHVEGEPNFYEIDEKCPLPPPTMSYPNQHPHVTSRVAGTSCGVPGPPVGYHSSHYSHPINYPPPAPYCAGRQADPHNHMVAAYPPYSYYPNQYNQLPPEYYQYPHHHFPPSHQPSLYDTASAPRAANLPSNNKVCPVKSKEFPSAPVAQHQELDQVKEVPLQKEDFSFDSFLYRPFQDIRVPTEDETKSAFEPLNIFVEPATIAIESIEIGCVQKGQK